MQFTILTELLSQKPNLPHIQPGCECITKYWSIRPFDWSRGQHPQELIFFNFMWFSEILVNSNVVTQPQTKGSGPPPPRPQSTLESVTSYNSCYHHVSLALLFLVHAQNTFFTHFVWLRCDLHDNTQRPVPWVSKHGLL